MARITVNTTGTQPLLLLSTTVDTAANIANGVITLANALSVTCLQDVTVTSSTGIFSWTDFCSIDTNKITTPADNEISTNLVIDPVGYFGNSSASANSAANYGISSLSQNKVEVQFKLVWNNSDANANAAASYCTNGVGYIASLAPTVSPDSPVWVTPMTLAVDGTMYTFEQ